MSTKHGPRRVRGLAARAVAALIAVAVAVVVAAAAPAGAAERIVVMELTGANVAPEVLRAVADRTRLSALGPARKIGHEVMTRESITLIVQQMGGACIDGQCEIEIARTVGAALVVTGEVRRLDQTYLSDLKLHDVARGTLLAAETYGGTSDLDIVTQTGAATERLLVVGFERYLGGPVAALKPRTADGVRRWYVDASVSRPVHWRNPMGAAAADARVWGWESNIPAARNLGFFPTLRVGRRFGPIWALELGGGVGAAIWQGFVAGGQAEILVSWATLASAWQLGKGSRFSFATEAGVAHIDGIYWGATGAQEDAKGDLAPTVGAQLRFDQPFGAWSIGARAGSLVVRNPSGAGIWMTSGYYTATAISASLRYGF